MNYNLVFEQAIESFVDMYKSQVYTPITEADVQATLFSLCMLRCQEHGLSLDIHCNHKHKFLDPNGRKKADLILGGSVAVEVKFEADYAGVSKPVVISKEAVADVERLRAMKLKGFPHCHFVFLDEDGTHYRNFLKSVENPLPWLVIDKGSEKKSYLLHLAL